MTEMKSVEQIASEMLTEQWRKGELPNGWYWCKCYNEEIKKLYYDGDCFELDDPETKNYYFFSKKDCAEIEILGKVPSYEEWQAKLEELVKELRKALQKETPALRVENAKLKTQLFLLKGLLDKWLPELDCYNDTLTSQFCREARELLGDKK